MILGTAAYMAPEQAKGREADKRCDVWAFGCVVYEMLTAKRAFTGEDITDTIAAIMRGEPDWSALPADTPANVRRLLETCLTKDRKQRAADIAVVQFLLSDRATVPSAGPTSDTTTPRHRRTRIAIAAVILLGAISAAVTATALLLGRPSPDGARVAFDLTTPDTNGPLHLALSPDGARLVALARSEKGSVLWLRTLEHVTGQTIPGTEWSNPATGSGFPFWSPDGRSVGLFLDGKLKKIDFSGAPPQDLADARDGHGGAWNRDGVIVLAPDSAGPLFRVSAAGGVPAQITDLDPKRLEIAHRHPAFLPDGRHFIYLAVSSKAENSALFVGSLDSKEPTFLVAAQSRAAFAPPDSLLFVIQTALMAQRMDMTRFELRGDPVRVADGVGTNIANSAAGFTVSENGVLAWRTGTEIAGGSQLSWLDRTGKATGTIGGPAAYREPALSPDQQHIVVDQAEGSGRDLWILDAVRGTKSRFTFDPADDRAPIWSPDGARIVFASNRAGGVFNLYQKNAGGAGTDELLLTSEHNLRPEDWSSDGRFILYRDMDANTKADLWVLPLTGDRTPQPVLRTEFNEQQGRFSPDGRWIAYISDESGRRQVFVQPFPVSGTKYQMSTQDSAQPRWRADGKELFFLSEDRMVSVELSVPKDGSLRAGLPKTLFPVLVQSMDIERNSWDVAPDGQRFLVNLAGGQGTNALPITVILNWKAKPSSVYTR
jgi:Tol biopolymer transport system component